ncbi:hypothetical protein AsFcp4_58 [Aeromonas phage AsFcp_4]|uniref:HTH psq-type domain-containing protein n=1 Tax=Aeromonas phage PX29 TaxID=926067 RepID=E5DQF9_9CAUD|nr:hypothetical protein CL89_gp252 [Aeromonas phage PX29]ADQ52945.1 conserved hypothetical protein [Aeromonas phage PX29]QAX98483.1 hypothetical protein ASfcp2_145 [Aeromonas phage AsFcp_2]QAX99515.1 hypothetical protein AsFcp4_58 [Aeromonas phage AsFcp_4]
MSNAIKIKAHFMNENGVAKAEIARQLEVSASTVSRWIKEVEQARIQSKSFVVMDVPSVEQDQVEIVPPVVQRRKIWTFTPTKVERKQRIEKREQQKKAMPQTAMTMAFEKAVMAG